MSENTLQAGPIEAILDGSPEPVAASDLAGARREMSRTSRRSRRLAAEYLGEG